MVRKSEVNGNLNMVILHLKNISKKFKNDKNSFVALNKVNCAFEENKIHVILGPSGCGKTTLLNIIAGLVKPTQGEVYFKDKIITGPNPDIGNVFQDLRLFPWLKTGDNVAFGLALKNITNIEKKVAKYLDAVGLSKFREYYPAKLSGGMKQRLAIARSLVLEPEVLLLDEPFGDLDPKTRRKMQDLILKLQKKFKTTIIFVTHDIDEAVRLGDKVYFMSGLPGAIVKFYNNIPINTDKQRILKSKLLDNF